MARWFDAAIKNAVASHLPTAMRRTVYSTDEPIIAREQGPRVDSGPQVIDGSPEVHPSADSTPVPTPDQEVGGCRTVLLLGSETDHARNHRMLGDAEFSPLRVSCAELLESLLTHEVCGIIVARSWWAIVATEDHEPLLRRLMRHSSFAWIKVDVEGLHGTPDIRELCRKTRHEDPNCVRVRLSGRMPTDST